MTSSEPLVDQIREIVGDSGKPSGDLIPGYTIDDTTPKSVVIPASVQEVQDVLRFASEKNISLLPLVLEQN